MARDRLAPVTRRMIAVAAASRLEGPDAATFERVAGPILKPEVQAAATAAFGADLKPWGTNRGPKATFGYDMTRGTSGRPRLEFKLRGGAWLYGEHGAQPHLIGTGRGAEYRRVNRRTKTGKVPKGTRRRYVKGAGYKHPVQAPIFHPGTKGRRAIRYVFKRVRAKQQEAVAAGMRAVLAEAVRRG